MSVNVKIHACEVHFDDARPEIGHLSGRIGLDGCLGVLYHHHTVAVVSIGNGESCFGKAVKERLLCVAIILKSLVIIEVVTG